MIRVFRRCPHQIETNSTRYIDQTQLYSNFRQLIQRSSPLTGLTCACVMDGVEVGSTVQPRLPGIGIKYNNTHKVNHIQHNTDIFLLMATSSYATVLCQIYFALLFIQSLALLMIMKELNRGSRVSYCRLQGSSSYPAN